MRLFLILVLIFVILNILEMPEIFALERQGTATAHRVDIRDGHGFPSGSTSAAIDVSGYEEMIVEVRVENLLGTGTDEYPRWVITPGYLTDFGTYASGASIAVASGTSIFQVPTYGYSNVFFAVHDEQQSATPSQVSITIRPIKRLNEDLLIDDKWMRQ
jgi:hypothetical protein